MTQCYFSHKNGLTFQLQLFQIGRQLTYNSKSIAHNSSKTCTNLVKT